VKGDLVIVGRFLLGHQTCQRSAFVLRRKPRQRTMDQAGIASPELAFAEPQSGQDPRPEVLDQDIDPVDKRQRLLDSGVFRSRTWVYPRVRKIGKQAIAFISAQLTRCRNETPPASVEYWLQPQTRSIAGILGTSEPA
jgi:hypothetical protein